VLPEDRQCSDPSISTRELEKRVLEALIETLSDPLAMRASILNARAAWEVHFHAAAEHRESIQHQLDALEARLRQLSLQHEYGALTDAELKRRVESISESRHEAELAMKSLDAADAFPPIDAAELLHGPSLAQANDVGERERSWLLDPGLLEQQSEAIRVSVAMDTAILGATAAGDPQAMQQLDELAESLGLRVTIGDDGGLVVQFGLPLTSPNAPTSSAPPSLPIVSSPSPEGEEA
jgi:hypothetical protein